MLPQFLYGSYRRYKADTATFIDWLVETAKNCGYQATLKESSTATGKPASNQNSCTSTELPKCKISLREISRIAQTIAKSAVDVLPVVLATVKRAISSRKRCASWFSTSRKEADFPNKRHSHFIKALEELCETLEWKSPKHSAASSRKPTLDNDDGEN